MKASRTLAVPACALALSLSSGCAHKATVRPVESAPISTTSSSVAVAPNYVGNALSVPRELVAACDIAFGDVGRAPKFDFDQSDLLPQDRAVLDQVATCVTTGPLKGRSLKLVGRADPRGEVEYNFVLGEHRAGSVERYLQDLGVAHTKIIETSRGKLDATGTDEASWQRDRRVDLLLQ